ncbi:MAG: type II secretion system minor pseudopilin GspJ [Sphingomonadales bacterium]|nr:type II secretion system minor pseudopilin GspJ [Sphingomonadales bacterium]
MTAVRDPFPVAREAGFTLIEMLVALVIFAILAGAGVGLLRSSVDTQSIVATRLADVTAIERLRLVLAADLGQAVDRPTRGATGGTVAAFVGDGDRFALVRGGVANLQAQPRPSLQRVAWQAIDATVERRAFAALDGDDAGQPAALASEVARLSFRYRGADGGWRSSWPGAGDPPLPRAVETSLQRNDEAPLKIVIALPWSPLPAAAEAAQP